MKIHVKLRECFCMNRLREQHLTECIYHHLLLLVHGSQEQVRWSHDMPSHGLPPPDGGGLVHVRVRSRFPVPQVAEQVVHVVQVVQPPSTDKKEYQGCAKLIKTVSPPNIVDLFSHILAEQHPVGR